MFDAVNRPVRPPLKTPAPDAPKGDVRNTAESDPGGVGIEPERTGSRRPADSQRRNPTTAANAHVYARRKLPAKRAPPAKPVSEALAAAEEKAIRMAQELLEEFAQSLTREDCIRLARAFRSAVVPKRKPGRRRKPQVTAALADYRTGMRGGALYRKHIPGWDKHGEWRRKAEARALMDAIRSRHRRESNSAPGTPEPRVTYRRHDAA